MLPFGSFTTQLPLLIIGALYMFYLGMSAVNKEKSENLSEENRQIIEINDNNLVDYFTLAVMSHHSPANKSEPCFIPPSDFLVTSFIFLNKNLPISSFYGADIFARPPPKNLSISRHCERSEAIQNTVF